MSFGKKRDINNALAVRAGSGRDDARSAESASHRGKGRKGGGGALRPARAERTPRRRCSAAAAAAQGTSTLLRRQLEDLPRKPPSAKRSANTRLHSAHAPAPKPRAQKGAYRRTKLAGRCARVIAEMRPPARDGASRRRASRPSPRRSGRSGCATQPRKPAEAAAARAVELGLREASERRPASARRRRGRARKQAEPRAGAPRPEQRAERGARARPPRDGPAH